MFFLVIAGCFFVETSRLILIPKLNSKPVKSPAQDDDDDFAASVLQDDDAVDDPCSPESAEERCLPLTELHGECCTECYVSFVNYSNCISAEIFRDICPDFVPRPIDESIVPAVDPVEDDDSIVGDFSACDALELASIQCLEASCSTTEECGTSPSLSCAKRCK